MRASGIPEIRERITARTAPASRSPPAASCRAVAIARDRTSACCPLSRRQIDVTRTQRQAVGLAHNRHADDLHRHIEIAHHALDHGELLEILAAEEGNIGLDEVEELVHHRRHPAKVAGAAGAAEDISQPFDIDPGRSISRIEGGSVRGKDEIDAGGTGEFAVALQRARIGGEILASGRTGSD